MSELINNHRHSLDELKNLLLKLQTKEDIKTVKDEIREKLKTVPYQDVLTVEQELIAEGMPTEDMLELCDLHSRALQGLLPHPSADVPSGHPVAVFRKENLAINRELELFTSAWDKLNAAPAAKELMTVRTLLNNLMDIEKHYSRKENLLFPFLERYKITGPSVVMWGKDDQVRTNLKELQALFSAMKPESIPAEAEVINAAIEKTAESIRDMIQKEEDILFPMSLEALTEIDWWDINRQSGEIGFCLVENRDQWAPEGVTTENTLPADNKRIQFESGSLSFEELLGMFKILPVDVTFVDKNDEVRFFSEGETRIFQRSRAIIGRKVQYCHPPHSVSTVEKILEDFKSGRQSKAAFWIQMHGQFIHICYYALKDENGEYRGTLEVSQNLTEYRALEGERRILQYDEIKNTHEEKEETINMDTPKITYDARADLAAGIHPAEKVLSELATLAPGEKYLLITPFPPMPLIMKAKEKGFEAAQSQAGNGEFQTVFFH